MIYRKKHKKVNPDRNRNLLIQIILIVITSIVTSSFSHYNWKLQYDKSIEDKIYDKKFEVYQNISDNLAKHQGLLYSKIKIKVTSYLENINKKNQTIEEYALYEERLKKNLNYFYQDMVDYDNHLPNLLGSFYMAQALFGSKVNEAIASYHTNVINKTSEEYVTAYLIELRKQGNLQEVVTFDIRDLISFIEPEVNEYRAKVMEEMLNEIKLSK